MSATIESLHDFLEKLLEDEDDPPKRRSSRWRKENHRKSASGRGSGHPRGSTTSEQAACTTNKGGKNSDEVLEALALDRAKSARNSVLQKESSSSAASGSRIDSGSGASSFISGEPNAQKLQAFFDQVQKRPVDVHRFGDIPGEETSTTRAGEETSLTPTDSDEWGTRSFGFIVNDPRHLNGEALSTVQTQLRNLQALERKFAQLHSQKRLTAQQKQYLGQVQKRVRFLMDMNNQLLAQVGLKQGPPLDEENDLSSSSPPLVFDYDPEHRASSGHPRSPTGSPVSQGGKSSGKQSPSDGMLMHTPPGKEYVMHTLNERNLSSQLAGSSGKRGPAPGYRQSESWTGVGSPNVMMMDQANQDKSLGLKRLLQIGENPQNFELSKGSSKGSDVGSATAEKAAMEKILGKLQQSFSAVVSPTMHAQPVSSSKSAPGVQTPRSDRGFFDESLDSVENEARLIERALSQSARGGIVVEEESPTALHEQYSSPAGGMKPLNRSPEDVDDDLAFWKTEESRKADPMASASRSPTKNISKQSSVSSNTSTGNFSKRKLPTVDMTGNLVRFNDRRSVLKPFSPKDDETPSKVEVSIGNQKFAFLRREDTAAAEEEKEQKQQADAEESSRRAASAAFLTKMDNWAVLEEDEAEEEPQEPQTTAPPGGSAPALGDSDKGKFAGGSAAAGANSRSDGGNQSSGSSGGNNQRERERDGHRQQDTANMASAFMEDSFQEQKQSQSSSSNKYVKTYVEMQTSVNHHHHAPGEQHHPGQHHPEQQLLPFPGMIPGMGIPASATTTTTTGPGGSTTTTTTMRYVKVEEVVDNEKATSSSVDTKKGAGLFQAATSSSASGGGGTTGAPQRAGGEDAERARGGSTSKASPSQKVTKNSPETKVPNLQPSGYGVIAKANEAAVDAQYEMLKKIVPASALDHHGGSAGSSPVTSSPPTGYGVIAKANEAAVESMKHGLPAAAARGGSPSGGSPPFVLRQGEALPNHVDYRMDGPAGASPHDRTNWNPGPRDPKNRIQDLSGYQDHREAASFRRWKQEMAGEAAESAADKARQLVVSEGRVESEERRQSRYAKPLEDGNNARSALPNNKLVLSEKQIPSLSSGGPGASAGATMSRYGVARSNTSSSASSSMGSFGTSSPAVPGNIINSKYGRVNSSSTVSNAPINDRAASYQADDASSQSTRHAQHQLLAAALQMNMTGASSANLQRNQAIMSQTLQKLAQHQAQLSSGINHPVQPHSNLHPMGAPPSVVAPQQAGVLNSHNPLAGTTSMQPPSSSGTLPRNTSRAPSTQVVTLQDGRQMLVVHPSAAPNFATGTTMGPQHQFSSVGHQFSLGGGRPPTSHSLGGGPSHPHQLPRQITHPDPSIPTSSPEDSSPPEEDSETPAGAWVKEGTTYYPSPKGYNTASMQHRSGPAPGYHRKSMETLGQTSYAEDLADQYRADGLNYARIARYLQEEVADVTKPIPPELINYYAVVDFECTCNNDVWNFVHEIIEFPVIFINAKTWKIEYEFHRFVRPTEQPLLSEFCTNLTGISQATVGRAQTLKKVMGEFVNFCNANKLLGHVKAGWKSFVFITDGPSDILKFLRPEAHRKLLDLPEAFQRPWVDLRDCWRNVITPRHGAIPSLNIPKMLQHFNMDFQGRMHSGLHDARNIARIVHALRVEEGVQFVSRAYTNRALTNQQDLWFPPVKERSPSSSPSESDKDQDAPDSPGTPGARARKRLTQASAGGSKLPDDDLLRLVSSATLANSTFANSSSGSVSPSWRSGAAAVSSSGQHPAQNNYSKKTSRSPTVQTSSSGKISTGSVGQHNIEQRHSVSAAMPASISEQGGEQLGYQPRATSSWVPAQQRPSKRRKDDKKKPHPLRSSAKRDSGGNSAMQE